MTENKKAFGCYSNGFTLTFDNGLVLSTRFGKNNYCENQRDAFIAVDNYTDEGTISSDNAEVAVWKSGPANETAETREWENGWQIAIFGDEEATRTHIHQWACDDVRGWIKMSDWLKILNWCKEWKQ